MDPLTVTLAGAIALAGVSAGNRWRVRARHAEAQAAQLRRELQSQRHAASHDPLTGLLNRRAFYESALSRITDAARQPLVVIVIDLDDFKMINDEYGHAVGDEVLITIASRFRTYAGANMVARLGGDEFVGLFSDPDADERWRAATSKKLAELLASPVPIAGRNLVVTASVGLAPVSQATGLDEAVRRADAAMYQDKTRDRRRHRRPLGRFTVPGELTRASVG